RRRLAGGRRAPLHRARTDEVMNSIRGTGRVVGIREGGPDGVESPTLSPDQLAGHGLVVQADIEALRQVVVALQEVGEREVPQVVQEESSEEIWLPAKAVEPLAEQDIPTGVVAVGIPNANAGEGCQPKVATAQGVSVAGMGCRRKREVHQGG